MATVPKNTRSTVINLSMTSAGPFDIGFRLFDSDAVKVYVDGVEATAFTLAAAYANGFDDAATITFTSDVTAPAVITIEAALVPWREKDLVNGDRNLVAHLNVELARIVSSLAEIRRDVDRAIRGFDPLDPVFGIDLQTITGAGESAALALSYANAASASAAAALAAENSLLEFKGAWVTATTYAPSDIVASASAGAENGNAYVCMQAHTSGTFATDLAAGKWMLFVAKGASGAGTGDVIGANNGTEFNAGTFRANLALFGALSTAEVGADLLARAAANPRGMAFYCSTGCTNTPPGYGAGDIFISKGLDSNNVTILYVRKDGVLFTNVRSAGTWAGWSEFVTATSVASLISASQKFIHVRDQKPAGTAGGTFTAGSLLQRTLNTVMFNSISGASLASNAISLPAGEYYVEASAPAYAVNRHQAVLYNVTDSVGVIVGTSEFAHASYQGSSSSIIRGRISLAAPKSVDIRHICETSAAVAGFGVKCDLGLTEVFTEVMIWKIS